MTLLMVWTNKKNDASAINIASDSRLSSGKVSWDHGTKIQRLHPTSTWFGYCGDSFVGLSAIASATAAISNSDHLRKLSGAEEATVAARVGAIQIHLANVFKQLPKVWRRPATLIWADHDHRKGHFSAFTIAISSGGVSKATELDLTAKRVHAFGSGAGAAHGKLNALEKKGELKTATIVKALVEVIDSSDATVGGAPQMVMLTATKQTPIGFWWPTDNGKRHLFGMPIEFSSKMESVTWKTRNFVTKPFRPFGRK